MTTYVPVSAYAYSVNFLTDKILMSVRTIIRESGLNPARLADDWSALDRGLRTWLTSRHLLTVVLEVFNPTSSALIGRWDFDISYRAGETEGFWVDTDAIRYAIAKAGQSPSSCLYRVLAVTAPGRSDVAGWGSTTLRSTAGFVRHAIGATIGAPSAGSSAAYWRRSA